MQPIVRRLVALFALICATNAFAQTYTYSIYVDADNNAATGCGVSLPGGSVAGAESVLTATVDAGSPPTVTQVTRASCAGGSFGAPTAFGTAAIGVGAGSGGTTAIELGGALASLAPGATTLRLYVVGQSASGSDVLLTTSGAPDGGPILLALNGRGGAVPAPSIGVPAILLLGFGLLLFGSRAARRRLLKRALLGLAFVSGIAGAAIFNWNGVTPLASDPAGDATSGETAIDLRTFFAMLNGGNLQFRIDVGSSLAVPPAAVADSYTTPIGTLLTVPAPGVLGNDTLNSATISANTSPAHGTLALNADGSFSYTPASGYAGGDSFTYTLGNGGGSSTATVSLVVGSNHAPSFTKGADQTVLEDAAAQSIANWAGAISDGDGDTQTLDFIVTNTDNALFSAQPAVSPAGTLSYTLAANANGTATVSVQLHDNGGTVNGGVDTSPVQTFTITVTAVNDVPSFTKGADESVLEDSGAHSVPDWATNLSAGPADESGQALNFLASNDNAALFTVPPAVAANGTLSYTLANGQKGTATVSVRIHDDGGTADGGVDTSAVQTFQIVVAPVNHAPSFTKGGDQTVDEDAGAQTVTNWATAIDDGDGGGQTLAFQVTGNTNAALFSAAPAVSPDGTLTYTPAADANGAATITLVLKDNGGVADGGVDTSAPQTFTITVNPVDDAPVVTAGAAVSYTEGGAPVLADAALTVTDIDNATLAGATVQVTGNFDATQDVLAFTPVGTITGSYAAATGMLTLTGTDTLANYQTALRSVTYINSSQNPSTATRTLTWLANDGSLDSAPATSTVALTAVDNPSTVTAGDTLAYVEGSGPMPIDAGVTVSDPDSPALVGATVAITAGYVNGEDVLAFAPAGGITATFDAATGALTLTGDATPAAYQAALRTVTYANTSNNPSTAPRTVSWQVNDGELPSNIATSTVTVAAVDNAPVVTAGAAVTYTEGDPAVVADAALTVADVDSTMLAGATVQVTGNFDTAQDVLAFTPAGAISGSYAVATGTLTLTGSDTLANYQTALRSVTYLNTSQNPSTGTRTLSWSANDGTSTGAADTSTVTIISINSAPSFTKGADQVVNEDAGAQIMPSWATGISDGDGDGGGQTLTFQVTGNTNTALFSAAPAVSPTGTLTYTPAADANGEATITLVLKDNGGVANGGVDTSAPQTFKITVNSVNDPPSFTKGPDQTVFEDAGEQTVSPWATAISPGPADESAQTVTFNITGNTNLGLFSAGPSISSTGVLTYTPAANANGTAVITLVAKDSGGTANGGVDTSAPQTFSINVTAVNDAPSFVKGADQDVLDNIGAQTINPWATAISAGPNEASQTLNFIVSNDNPSAFTPGGQPAVSATGVLTYTPAVQSFAGNLTANVSVQIHDNGGTANGGVDTSAVQNLVIKITHANIAPAVVGSPKETFDTVGNVQFEFDGTQTLPLSIQVTGNLVANFTDSDGPSALSIAGIVGCADTTAPFDCVSANGGSVHLLANGEFTFTPKAGDTAVADTFQYQVTDGSATTSGRTVTINLKSRAWFVKNNAPAGGLGRSGDPFNTLAAAQTASLAGDYIFVYGGDLTSSGQSTGIALKANQKLYGEAYGLTVAATVNGVANPLLVAANAANRPLIDDTAVGSDGISATNVGGVEVRGVSASGASNAITLVTSGSGGGSITITDNVVRPSGNDGIRVWSVGTGAVTAAIARNQITGAAHGMNLAKIGASAGALTITDLADNTVTAATATGIVASGVIFDAAAGNPITTVSGGTTKIGTSGTPVAGSGMSLGNVTGDLAFTDLDIYNSAGSGLVVTSTGALNAAAGTGFRLGVASGVGTIESTGGPAISVSNASVNLPSLTSLKSINSASTGVSLVNAFGGVGGTTLSAATGQVTHNVAASGGAFVVDGGNGNVSFGGPIDSSSGNAVAVTNRASDTISFAGQITDNGSGLSLTNNTGATIGFTGPIVANTGANTAFNATGGGTVTATNTTSVISTTTATAINVVNTTIGAGGINFHSVSANGGTNGIVLTSTGSLGGLTVAGDGGGTNNGSGGRILNTTGDGILMTNVSNVSLGYMNITNPGLTAIKVVPVGWTLSPANSSSSNGVTNFTLNRCNLSDNAGSATADDGLTLSNASGNISITNDSIVGARHQGITIDNFNTNMASLNMTGTTVTGAQGGDGMLMQMRGTSVLASGTIGGATAALGNTFLNNSSTGLQVNNADTGNITSLTVSNNTVTNNNAGMDFDISQSSGMTVVVQNNTITNSHSQALNLVAATSASGASNLTATLRANNIGIAGAFDSGSAIGSGIRVANGGVNVNLTIDGNVIREVPNSRGITIEPQAYAPNLNVKAQIINNQVVRPSGTHQNIGCGANVPCPSASIFVLSDSNGLGGFDNVCTKISGNTAYDPTSWGAGGEAAYYFARRTSASNQLRLEGTNANAPAQILATNTVANLNVAGVIDENTSGPVVIVSPGTCGSFPP